MLRKQYSYHKTMKLKLQLKPSIKILGKKWIMVQILQPNYTIFKRKHGGKPSSLWAWLRNLLYGTNIWGNKSKDDCIYLKFKPVGMERIPSRRWWEKIFAKYLKMIYLIGYMYPQYLNNSSHSDSWYIWGCPSSNWIAHSK